jgi:hypothetical protein
MTIVVYPRLYTSRLPEGVDVVVSQGDESIELLHKLMIDGNTNTRSWPFYRNVLLNANRLFGDLRQWFQDQIHNPNIFGYNQQFITDTLNFIETGQRELSVLSWTDLVTSGGDNHNARSVPSRLINSKSSLRSSVSSLELLQRWVSQPGGFEDLLNTLYLLFGKARNH